MKHSEAVMRGVKKEDHDQGAPEGATPLSLLAQAQAATRLEDTLAHVAITAAGRTTARSISLWGDSRV